MWERKNHEEIAKERRKLWLAFGGPLMWFIIGFIIAVVETGSGLHRWGPIYNPITSLGQFFERAVIFAFLAAIFAYILQILLGKPIFSIDKSKTLICNKCYRVKSSDGQQSCDCGGKFEDFNLWKWIDDKKGDQPE